MYLKSSPSIVYLSRFMIVLEFSSYVSELFLNLDFYIGMKYVKPSTDIVV